MQTWLVCGPPGATSGGKTIFECACQRLQVLQQLKWVERWCVWSFSHPSYRGVSKPFLSLLCPKRFPHGPGCSQTRRGMFTPLFCWITSWCERCSIGRILPPVLCLRPSSSPESIEKANSLSLQRFSIIEGNNRSTGGVNFKPDHSSKWHASIKK